MTQDIQERETGVMVDLETLSTRANARILAIGAVKMFDGIIYEKFYQAVTTPDVETLRKYNDAGGFHVSNDTLNWWAQQSPEARTVFTDPNAVPIEAALTAFTRWVLSDTLKANVIMWGNGAAFDNSILSEAYALCGLEQPWEFWNDSCYRTLKRTNRDIPFIRTGTHHNALDDAESQAEHLIRILEKLDG